MFSLQDYRFDLPKHLIAETAASPAHNAKLMVISRQTGTKIADTTFSDLPNFLNENRVLFFNNSRVLRARLPLKNQKIFAENGEKNIADGEIFFLKNISENTFEALVRPGKKLQIGANFTIGKYHFSITNRSDSGRIIQIS